GKGGGEGIWAEEPEGFSAGMTFETRDRSRHSVERMARRSRQAEERVARIAIDCARAGAGADASDPRRAHVGYYLIDEGLAQLERMVGYRRLPGEAVGRWGRPPPNPTFVRGGMAATITTLCIVLWLCGALVGVQWLAVLSLGMMVAGDIAVSVVNQLVTNFLPPRLLPKLDLKEHGVPPEFRTAVVIPTLFPSVAA